MRGQADTHVIRRRIDDRAQHGGQRVGLEVLAARAEQRDVAKENSRGSRSRCFTTVTLLLPAKKFGPDAMASAVPVRSIVTVAGLAGYGCSQTTEPSQKSRTATRRSYVANRDPADVTRNSLRPSGTLTVRYPSGSNRVMVIFPGRATAIAGAAELATTWSPLRSGPPGGSPVSSAPSGRDHRCTAACFSATITVPPAPKPTTKLAGGILDPGAE
jgi:hypothetical protein